MKISLSQLCDYIAEKISIDKNDLKIKAWFPLDSDESMSKYESSPRDFMYSQYSKLSEKDKIMKAQIYYNGTLILQLKAHGISPKENDLYEILDIDFIQNCVGPGFYYNYPYFKIDGREAQDVNSMQNYQKFITSTKIYTSKTKIKSYLKDLTNFTFAKNDRESRL